MPTKFLRYLYHKATPVCAPLLFLALALSIGGCLYPPMAPKTPIPNHLLIDSPYDITWDATMKVVTGLGYHVDVKDPVHGLLEMEGQGFTLDDANCGVVETVGGKQTAYPTIDSTAVFNISLVPHGNEATDVAIDATYTTPVQVPFHPKRDLKCVSTGSRESILLRKIAAQAKKMHRPSFKAPTSG